MDKAQWEQGPVADSHEHGKEYLGFPNVPDRRNDYPASPEDVLLRVEGDSYSVNRTEITARTTPTITVIFLLVSSVGWSSSDRGSPGSTPDQSMWDLRRTKWHWQRFLSAYFCFTLYHSTNDSHSLIRLSATLNDLRD